MKTSRFFLTTLVLTASLQLHAQSDNLHLQSDSYQWPTEPEVRAKLETWRDQKFGIIIHWGLYSVPGIVESWELCSEPWIERDSTVAYEDHKKWYWGLINDFNPIRFEPEQWAKVAWDAGMRYLVFTTKHHDGFCLFDTKQTDFKITNGPFSSNPKADVTQFVFDAFRKQNFMIGAYFSKPDWHSQDYWWPKYATPNRNANYDLSKYPWRWNRFKQFTYNQIYELMHQYGSIDILWLDGGWVFAAEAFPANTPETKRQTWKQEVDIPKIATMARMAQPGLLVVDRTIAGPFENYQTPEQSIPKVALNNPWESCITLSHNWGYAPNDTYMSPTKVIHNLIEIVAKGGNLLLGVGPRPDGTLDPKAVAILGEIGSWMNANNAAIYGTRLSQTYRDGETFFTQSKDGKTSYALVRLPEGTAIPPYVEWKLNFPKKGATLKLLSTNTTVKWRLKGDRIIVELPKSFVSKKSYPALTFEFH